MSDSPRAPRSGGPNELPLSGVRVIFWILIGTSVAFVLVSWLIHPLVGIDVQVPEASLLTVLGVLAPMEYVAWRVVARNLRPRWVEAGRTWRPEDPVPQAWLTQCLLGAALTTSVGFFAGIVVLMTGSNLALSLATGAVGLLLIQLPDEDSLRTP